MTEWTYEDREYWNRVYRLADTFDEEQVFLDGNDGEDDFDRMMLRAAENKEVLDLGCGDGLFSHEIAKTAGSVVGIDFSENALVIAKGDHLRNRPGNMEFRLGEAKSLPFADELFDLVISRRGPATANETTLSEVFRVLKPKGILMEITIGEKNTRNLAEIFRRGQMYDETERVAVLKKKMVERAGFKEIQIEEYLATEIFPSIEQLILRLNDSPIIPGFDAKNDEHFLRLVEERCKTPRGIETPAHRVTIIARK